jgi:large-conductance mechanosensitive channel
MSFILNNELVMSFKEFASQQQIPGVAIGFLLAQTTLDIARTGVSELILPLVTALRTASAPSFDLELVFQAIVTWLVTMMVIFTVVKIFNLQTQKVPVVATVSNARL